MPRNSAFGDRCGRYGPGNLSGEAWSVVYQRVSTGYATLIAEIPSSPNSPMGDDAGRVIGARN